MKKLCIFLTAFSFFLSCGPQDARDIEQQSYQSKYLIIQGASSNNAFLIHAIFGQIRIHINGPTTAKISKPVITTAINTWIQPLRAYASNITNDIQVGSFPSNYHFKINVQNGSGRAYTYPEQKYMQMYTGADYMNDKVVTHELGHAFGLEDTYLESGGCKPGQPNSIMCTGESLKLMADDLAGIKKLFCQTFRDKCNGTEPKNPTTTTGGDVTPPTDVTTPDDPGTSDSGTTVAQKIGFSSPSGKEVCPDSSQRDLTFECDDSCNVREKPGKDYQKIGTVKAGTQYKTYRHACNKKDSTIWYEIDYDGKKAWVWALRYF